MKSKVFKIVINIKSVSPKRREELTIPKSNEWVGMSSIVFEKEKKTFEKTSKEIYGRELIPLIEDLAEITERIIKEEEK